jgi:hypothetical protein
MMKLAFKFVAKSLEYPNEVVNLLPIEELEAAETWLKQSKMQKTLSSAVEFI